MIIPSRCAPFVWRHSGRHNDRRRRAVATLRVAPLSLYVDRRLACRLGNRLGGNAAARGFCRTADAALGAGDHQPASHQLRRLASSFPVNITDVTSGPCGCSTANTQFRNLRSIVF
jgi:hypothetical protein